MRKKEKKERTRKEFEENLFMWLAIVFCLLTIGWVVMAVIDFGLAICVLLFGAGIVVLMMLALLAAAQIAEGIANMMDFEE